METASATVASVLHQSAQLIDQLLAAAGEATNDAQADYCRRTARDLWNAVCRLRDDFVASEMQLEELTRICEALDRRLVASGA